MKKFLRRFFSCGVLGHEWALDIRNGGSRVEWNGCGLYCEYCRALADLVRGVPVLLKKP